MSILVVCLIAYVLAYVSSMPILGPVAVMAVTRGIEGRFDEARKLGIGASVAEGTYAGIAFATFATLFTRYPIVLPISRVITSIVLCVVGVSFARYAPKLDTAVKERNANSAFGLGFLTSALNPTILAMWTGAATGIYSRQIVDMKPWIAVPFGLSVSLGITSWYFTLTALMSKYHSRLPTRLLGRIIRTMGVVLLGVAAWTMYSAFRG